MAGGIELAGSGVELVPDGSGAGITSLTGDVTATGPGAAAATLASSISGAKAFTTSVAIGGAAIGSNALAINGTASFDNQMTGPLSGINCNTEIRMIDPPPGGFSLFGVNHTDPLQSCFATDTPTDLYNRFVINGNGRLGWGDGITSAADVYLSRTSLKTLSVSNYLAVSGNSSESVSPLLINGSVFTGGTGVTTLPQLLIQPSGTSSSAWNTSGTLIAGNGASGFSGNLLDLKVAGITITSASAAGNIQTTGFMTVGSSGAYIISGRSILSSAADGSFRFLNNGQTNSVTISFPTATVTPTLQLGALDAAAPVAQTIRVQSVAAGTAAANGANWTLIGSLPTGTGTSGDIIIQTGVKTGSGTTQGTATTALTIKGETQAVIAAGTFQSKDLRASKTANYTVVAADTGTQFDNIGAAGEVDFTLPTAAVGLKYGFTVKAAQVLKVIAGSSTIIAIGTSISASAGNIQASAAYSSVQLEAISTTEWVATSGASGTWTVT